MRLCFEQFAQDNRFDPLIVENWYSYTARSFATYPVSIFFFSFRVPILPFSSSPSSLLSTLYSPILSCLRPFFPSLLIYLNQDANYVLANFNGSFVAALVNLFPELSLDESKFIALKRMTYPLF